jgi:hypothetical protein
MLDRATCVWVIFWHCIGSDAHHARFLYAGPRPSPPLSFSTDALHKIVRPRLVIAELVRLHSDAEDLALVDDHMRDRGV